MIRFTPQNHEYSSIDPEYHKDWIGVSHLIGCFKQPFDAVAASEKVSVNPRSKWFGLDPAEIRSIWKQEGKRSLIMGSWYHNKTEACIISDTFFKENGTTFNVIKPVIVGEEKYAPNQKLEEGHIYPEHLMYLYSDGICGQSDRVEVVNGHVNVRDYKTSKTIKTESFVNWEGISARMLEPLSHLDDCNYVHYALQLSLYLYMILKHNPQLKPGILTLEHVIFKVDYLDKYGYPVHATDNNGEFIIEEVKPIIFRI